MKTLIILLLVTIIALPIFGQQTLTIGSTVQLKSGGPDMTVKSIKKQNDTETVTCTYFDNNKELVTESFDKELLKWIRRVPDEKYGKKSSGTTSTTETGTKKVRRVPDPKYAKKK